MTCRSQNLKITKNKLNFIWRNSMPWISLYKSKNYFCNISFLTSAYDLYVLFNMGRFRFDMHQTRCISYIDNNIDKQPLLVSKCNCLSQKPLLTTGIWTRDLWFRGVDIRPLDQPAVIHNINKHRQQKNIGKHKKWMNGRRRKWTLLPYSF
jgi:hypothetical protein